MKNKLMKLATIICLTSIVINHLTITSATASTITNTITTTNTTTDASTINNLTLKELVSTSIAMPQNGIDEIINGGTTSKNTNHSSFTPDYTKIYYITDMADDEVPVYYYKFSSVNIGQSYPEVIYNGYMRTYDSHTLSAARQFSIMVNNGDTYKKVTGGTLFSNSAKTNSRYQTKRLSSIEDIAKLSNPSSGKLQNIILTAGVTFADSLSSILMASKLQAPIIFINSENDTSATSYITRQLDPNGAIYILGGTGAVSDNTEWYFKLKGYRTIRLGGDTRYDTCEAINNQFPVSGGNPVIIASGENFPDALSISSISVIKNYPIYLTMKDTLPDQTSRLLSRTSPSQIYVIGGAGVISDNVISKLKKYSNNITRISGTDRYETSINVCKYFNIGDYNIAVTTGTDFKYALAGSLAAAMYNAPILLVDGNTTKVKQYLDGSKYSNILILGDAKTISTDTEKALVQ
ncbi:cell wall-binding repeat-containing protein [Clostridium sp. WILCCON 0269]|uniref:Cell wall-binding repeat-containing protein n=1 Tax=Candidatus Clostridium eludens TaxID=3381663 RepID=A0ABW8SJN0_9CLOT